MGSILTNGVFLPAEGERNCYEGLAANWTALDRLIGGYNAHIGNATIHVTAEDKQAWNNHVADTVKHVTAEDKQAWNDHVADTVKHVTAEDKQAWNNHVADTVKHVTAEDKAKWDAVTSKADDSRVVHNSGNETIDGNKSLLKSLKIKNEDVTRGSTTGSGSKSITFTDAGDNTLAIFSVGKVSNGSTAIGVRVDTTDNNDVNINSQFQFFITKSGGKVINPNVDGDIALGRSSNRWANVQTYKLNSLEPSSLGMPDLSNGIDISSYFDASQISTNTYTAPENGYINLAISSPNRGSINAVIGSDFWATTAYGAVNPNDSNTFLQCMLVPILKNQTITVYLRTKGGTMESAKFYPCLGNV